MTEVVPSAVSEEPGGRGARTRSWGSFRKVARIAVPLLILAGVGVLHYAAASYWTRFYGLSLAVAFVGYLAVVGRGRMRDAAVVIASILIALAAVETYSVLHFRTSIDTNTAGYSVFNPVLGWGPEHPGVYHHVKTDIKTGQVVLDVDYTIDAHLTRKVDSPADAPTVAIGGGSDVFGIGVPDAATLPQAFADATGRRFHVVNLAFSGYGPQQFLRILETGLHDDILTRPRVFVFAAAPELAERSACNRGYTLHGPRYQLVDGQATYTGTCGERFILPLRWLFMATSLFDIIAAPLDDQTVRQKLDLYIAILIRAGQLAQKKYGAQMAVFYLDGTGYPESGGSTDDEVIARLRAGGLLVVKASLDPAAFPGQDLWIPGDGHPTPLAHRARAALLVQRLGSLLAPAPDVTVQPGVGAPR
jgi:hypothetical protein